MKMEASPVTQPNAEGGSSRPSSLTSSSTFLKRLNPRFGSPNFSQSSAGKKMEASPVTQPDADNGSSRPSSSNRRFSFSVPKHITLYNWWLIRTEEFSGHHNLGIGGFHSDPLLGLRMFVSAAISKRYEANVLKTFDGVNITVVGAINRERTIQNGFSPEVCDRFFCGFPYDWEEYVGADGSISRANDDARVVPQAREGNSHVTSKDSQEDEISIKNSSNVEEDASVVGTTGRPSTKKRKSRVVKEGIEQEKSFLLSPPRSESVPSTTEVPSKRRRRQDAESLNEKNTRNLKLKATKAATGLRKHSTSSQLGTKGTQKVEGKSVLVACKTSIKQLTLRSRSIDKKIKRQPS